MKIQALAVAFALLCAVGRAADDPSTALPGVTDLTPANFDKIIDGKKAALIEFYAPWCGHCKMMTPEYKKLGELVANDADISSKVIIAKVNADEHSQLAERFGITGFPTVKWIGRGRTSKDAKDYRGQRTANDFLEYIKAALSREAAFARIPELSALAQKLVETTAAAEQSTIVADAEKAVAKLEDDAKTNGELYLKYMAKVVAQGKEYVAKELARLQKLIAGGMSAAKQAEVSRKVSVLSSFEKGAADPSEEPEEPEPEEEAYGYGGYGGDFADGIDIDFGAEGIELDVPEDAGVE